MATRHAAVPGRLWRPHPSRSKTKSDAAHRQKHRRDQACGRKQGDTRIQRGRAPVAAQAPIARMRHSSTRSLTAARKHLVPQAPEPSPPRTPRKSRTATPIPPRSPPHLRHQNAQKQRRERVDAQMHPLPRQAYHQVKRSSHDIRLANALPRRKGSSRLLPLLSQDFQTPRPRIKKSFWFAGGEPFLQKKNCPTFTAATRHSSIAAAHQQAV